MSANISILKPDAGHLLSDAAVYDPDGTLVTIRSKITMLPNMPAAMTTRGHLGVIEMLSMAFADAADFDTWRASADRVMDEFVHWMRRRGATDAEMLFDVTVVGWSASRGRPAGYSFTTAGERAHRWTEWPFPGFAALGPQPDPATLAAHGFPLGAQPSTLQVRDGLAFMEAQRATPDIVSPGYEDSEIGFAVGGFAEAARVDAEGVTMQRLRTWPDAIGSKIVPGAIEHRAPDAAPALGAVPVAA